MQRRMDVLSNALQELVKLNVLMDFGPRGHSVSWSPCPLVTSEYCDCHAAAAGDNFEHFLTPLGLYNRIPAFLPKHGIYDSLLPLSPICPAAFGS